MFPDDQPMTFQSHPWEQSTRLRPRDVTVTGCAKFFPMDSSISYSIQIDCRKPFKKLPRCRKPLRNYHTLSFGVISKESICNYLDALVFLLPFLIARLCEARFSSPASSQTTQHDRWKAGDGRPLAFSSGRR